MDESITALILMIRNFRMYEYVALALVEAGVVHIGCK